MELSISLDPSSGHDLMNYLAFTEGVDGAVVHLDIMDGVIVPRKSITADEYKEIVTTTTKKIDVHLMVADVDAAINPYLAKAVWGSIRSITFHPEVSADPIKLMKKIKALGVRAGIAIDLPVALHNVAEDVLAAADTITIMTVKYGASGQRFNEPALEKVRTLRAKYPNLQLIVDGGINLTHIKKVAAAGATTAVVGSAIYKAKDRTGYIKKLMK